jgi:thiosulfate dehydrogenase
MPLRAWDKKLPGSKLPRLLFWLLFGLLATAALAACASLGIGKSAVAYQPPQPTEAPKDIQDAVILGQNILNDPQKYVPDHVGNDMKCSNCHFNAGMTQGGKNGGISLVGVGATYPLYRDRQKYAVNIVTRLND